MASPVRAAITDFGTSPQVRSAEADRSGMGVTTDRTDTDEGPGRSAPSGLPGPEWVTPAEAALLGGTTEEAVTRAIADGRLHAWASKDGRRILIHASELHVVAAPQTDTPPWIEVDPASLTEWSGSDPGAQADEAVAPSPPPRPETVVPEPTAEVPEAEPDAAGPLEAESVETHDTDEQLEAEPDAAEPPRIRSADGRRRGRVRAGAAAILVIAAALVARSLFLTPDAHPALQGSPPPAHGRPTAPPAQPTTPPTAVPTAPPTVAPTGKPRPVFLNKPVFSQRGPWLTVATRVTNPNRRFALGPTNVTFVVRDRGKHVLAIRTTRVSAAPGSFALAVATDVRINPAGAKAATVVARAQTPAWSPAATFVPPAIRVDGAGFASSGPGDLRVVAALSNAALARVSGRVLCVVADASGGLTGAVTSRVSLWPGQARMFSFQVARPGSGSHRVQCEIMPEGR